jgi:hypothetical protein
MATMASAAMRDRLARRLAGVDEDEDEDERPGLAGAPEAP